MNAWGFPILQIGGGFKLIEGIDFAKAFQAGEISFEKNGIHLEYQGNLYNGYMFMQEYPVSRYNTFPKFHLTKCDTIQGFIQRGLFKDKYVWSNSAVNDVIDMADNKLYENRKLDFCKNCKRQLFDGINTTEDFFDSLDKTTINKDVWVDIYGYTKDWPNISRAYRQLREHTCESCGIKVNPIDRRYLHTHHINGDKTNNSEENLECLCILCHAHKDSLHEENFNKNRLKKQIAQFIEKYREQLINNLYIMEE